MATRRITLTGKAEWCKPYRSQLDMEYEDDVRGGNYSSVIILDEASIATFNALGTKAKLKDGNKLTIRRYERHGTLGELGPVLVDGVEGDTPIGNGSDIEVSLDIYDYEYKGKVGRGIRWVGVNVLNLVVYEKPVASRPAPAPVPVD